MDSVLDLLSQPMPPALPDVTGTVTEAKRRDIRVYPQRVNRASSAGHDCARFLVLSRTRWQERQPNDVTLQFIFDGGNMVEDMAMRQLRAAGFTITEQQRSLDWPKYELTGHLDGCLIDGGQVYPFDVKSVSPWAWDKIGSLDDMLASDRHWVRHWPVQLLLYMWMKEQESGFLYLVNKVTYVPKVVWIHLSDPKALEVVEATLQRLETVNAHVKAGTLPDGIDDAEQCPECPFFHVCLPEIKQKAIDLSDDPDLIAKLQRRETLAAAAKEYEAIDKAVKDALKGKERAIVGDFLVTGKQVPRKGYTVADSTYWQSTIARLDKQPTGQATLPV